MHKAFRNVPFDTHYGKEVAKWWYVQFTRPQVALAPEEWVNDASIDTDTKQSKKGKKKKTMWMWWIDSFAGMLAWKPSKKKGKKWADIVSDSNVKEPKDKHAMHKELEHLVMLPDNEYKPKMISSTLRKFIVKVEDEYKQTIDDFRSHIAPSYREMQPWSFNLSGMYGKTYFVHRYPSYVDFLWIRDLIAMYGKWDMSWYIYPTDDAHIKWMLKKRATALKAEIHESQSKWITIDTETEIEYRDVESIREKLATREERYFETSYYVNVYADDTEKLREEWRKFEQKLAWFWMSSKVANFRMDEWMVSCAPLWIDDLAISRSSVTTSLWGSFPFMSNDLIDPTGILYGINSHTWSLVIFDRFSKKLTNANSVVLATSWAWKSFAVKLEILRYLMLDVDIIVIDPENEYKDLSDKVWGQYVNIAVNSSQYVNPFDLPPQIEDRDYRPWDLLRSQIMSLIWLFNVLLWWLSPEDEAILDKAIQAAYALKEITFEDDKTDGKTIPRMEDLLYTLESMTGGDNLAIRLSKYVTWTFGQLFNTATNIDLNNKLTVFSIRDLEEALKTPAMYNVLNYIWTRVRAHKRKRLLIVDEAWIMMQHDMSANFLFGLIKRARKYGLWVTTITQDVEDFVRSPYGKPIVSNSSMQLLLKQSTISMKSLSNVFDLSEAEKQRLVSANVWEGLFFAWNQHVWVRILASPQEKNFITTDI